MNQLQHFELARRAIADRNAAFVELVTCKTNPLTRRDLEALIAKRPDRYGAYAGWLDKLPA